MVRHPNGIQLRIEGTPLHSVCYSTPIILNYELKTSPYTPYVLDLSDIQVRIETYTLTCVWFRHPHSNQLRPKDMLFPCVCVRHPKHIQIRFEDTPLPFVWYVLGIPEIFKYGSKCNSWMP